MIALSEVLPWAEIILSLLLVSTILLQSAGEGGLGSAFGGGDTGSFQTKRGFEKILFVTTIIVAILFGLTAFIALLI